MEGKYWKRKLSAVATEYRKWRLHYKEKNVSNNCIFFTYAKKVRQLHVHVYSCGENNNMVDISLSLMLLEVCALSPGNL